MRGIVAIVVFAVAASSACVLADFGEFTSGSDAGVVDAGSRDADAAPTVSDAAFTTDAFDAMIDAGGGDAFSCSGGAYLLCATFDDGQTSTSFSDTEVKAGGSLSVDKDARSGPFALRSQLLPMTDTPHQYARVSQKFTGTKSLRVTFDIKVATPAWASPDDRAVALMAVDYPGTSNSTYFFRAFDEMTLSQEQNGVYVQLEALPYDTWTRVTFEIVPTSPKGSLRMYYDGRIVLAQTNVSFDAPAASAATQVFIGMARFDPPAPAFDVRYDSVIIEEIP